MWESWTELEGKQGETEKEREGQQERCMATDGSTRLTTILTDSSFLLSGSNTSWCDSRVFDMMC